MTSRIFADTAPFYWAAGLPAIPLIPGEKRPAPNGWQIFGERMPTTEEQEAWLKHYADGNIGLPLGPASGLVAFDIDTDDPKILKVLESILPRSPWQRVGKKGMVSMYRYTGEKTTRFKTAEGMICELLSKGTQVVLPPSIHPETKRAYVSNCNLWEVIKALPVLTPGIESMIREALMDIGVEVGSTNNYKVSDFIPAGQRDNTMTWHAGVLARAVTRGERSLLEVLGEMEHWVTSYVENVVGDPMSISKAQGKVIEFVVRDVTGPRRQGLPIGWDEGLTDADKEKLGLKFTEDDEKWGATRILEYLAVEFQRFSDPASEGQLAAINVALDRIARSEGEVSVLEEERIYKFISAQTSNTVTMGALKRQVQVLRKGDIEGENHNEIAVEVKKYLDVYGEIRYNAGQFWQWKGSHWERKDENEIIKVISNEFGFYPACRKSSDYTGIMKLMRSTAAEDLVQINLKGINFANGYLTENFDLVPHHPDYGVTYVLPYRYIPEAASRMSLFNGFLTDSWGEDADFEDKVKLMQEMMGVTMFSQAPKYQRAFCLFGQAGSGKSVANQIMRHLIPSSTISAVKPEDWGDKFLPAGMYGMVMNFAGELSETKFIPGDVFKMVIEGELITSQFKNVNAFQFRPYCAQWFNSNHLPKTRDTSSGFTRRWVFLEWSRAVPQDKIVVDLANRIVDLEREAIAAWAVEGYKRLKENGDFTYPSSHMALVDQMATDNNSVRYFLKTSPMVIKGKENLATRKVNWVSSSDLYNEYWSFCLATGIARRASTGQFIRMMRELQMQFGFKTESRDAGFGSQEIIFTGVTIVGK